MICRMYFPKKKSITDTKGECGLVPEGLNAGRPVFLMYRQSIQANLVQGDKKANFYRKRIEDSIPLLNLPGN